LSPQKQLNRDLKREVEIRQSRLLADKADLIQEDQRRQKATKAELNLQRMARIDEAIQAEREANKNYVLNEQLALNRHN
jgi:hypothetical protein